MAVFPFTPSGVAQKQAELYALSDTALAAVVKQIAVDLNSWLKANFTLEPEQTSYLDSLPPLVTLCWGGLLAGTISGHGPIIMDDPKNYGPSRRTKKTIWEIGGDSNYTPPTSGTGPLESTVTLKIRYEWVD